MTDGDNLKHSIFSKIFIALAVSAIIATAASAGTMAVYYGGVKKGDVPARENSQGGKDIAVDEAVSALGLARTGNSQGIVVVMSGKKMEFWNNSGIVRVSGTIVSLPAPVSTEGGHWWIDTRSAKKVFDQFYYSLGRRNGVSFMEGSAEPPAAKAAEPVKKQEPQSTDVRKTETPPAEAKNTETAPKQTRKRMSVKQFILQRTSANKTHAAKSEDLQTSGTVKYEPPVQSAVSAEPQAEPVITGNFPPITPVFKGKKRPVVVLDAGHGAHDPGASGNGVIEKNINLKAVLQLGEVLEAYGVDVRYSRKTDVFLKLGERTAFANSNKADVFVSLHCNSLPRNTNSVAGVEIYLMASPRDKDSLQLAITENREISGNARSVKDLQNADARTRTLLKILGDMQQNNKISESTQLVEMLTKSMKTAGLPMRKVSQAPFFVLRGAGMPAVLIEMGYLTNSSEASKLNDANYREELCRAIAQGVVSYIKTY
jgi:N-acetylmuramoyl-L-alanine amidase